MLWIALSCPALPLDRVRRRFPPGALPALAITDRIGNRGFVLHVSPRAKATGVAAGQTVATALAMLPDLILVERDRNDEALALREAACCALRYTPSVVEPGNRSVEGSGNAGQPFIGIIAEISASLRLFGGLDALVRSIAEDFAEQGLAVAAAVAPTAGAAGLLAKSLAAGEKLVAGCANFTALLDRLPISLLESALPYLDTLRGIGCTRLAEFGALPRKGLARRFGTEILAELDRAYCRRPDPRTWFAVPESFASRIELMARVETVEALLFLVKRMIGQLAGWLAARHAAAEALTFVMHHEPRRGASTPASQTSKLTIRLAEPSYDPRHLAGLLRERLERTPLAAPVEGLELIADRIVLRKTPNGELFLMTRTQATTLNRLIEKLSARLGPQAVKRLRPIADHRPEKSQAVEQALNDDGKLPCELPGNIEESSGESRNPSFRASPRPVWLLDAPLPLEVAHEKPFYRSAIELLAGPERIEAGWWDDAPATRDYFIAQNDLGQMLWVFRERIPSEAGSGWYLHGLFG